MTQPRNIRDNRHRCDECGKPHAIFIEDERQLCRNCATIHESHRLALNVLLKAGLLYPTN